jgi:dTDP-4-amino-4,6-dideoxygalactose transaminase
LYTQRGNDAYPLSEMQAAVLLPQLQQLDARNAARAIRAGQLANSLSSQSLLKPTLAAGELIAEQYRPVFYKSGFILSDQFDTSDREQISLEARQLGIPLDPALPALHLTHSSRRFRAIGELVNAQKLHARLMTLHHTALLQSESEIEKMAAEMLQRVSSRVR